MPGGSLINIVGRPLEKLSLGKLFFHSLYFSIPLGTAIIYETIATQTSELNPAKWEEVYEQRTQEITRQREAQLEAQREEKERIFRLMIKDNDFNGNGSLEQGVEQDSFVDSLSQSDF